MILQEDVCQMDNLLKRDGVAVGGVAETKSPNPTRGMAHPAPSVKICCIPFKGHSLKTVKNVAINVWDCPPAMSEKERESN